MNYYKLYSWLSAEDIKVSPEESETVVTMGSTQELQMLLAKKDAKIRELELENMELKSKLDMYQSVFPSNPPASGSSSGPEKTTGLRNVNRALGLSAEPQSLKNLQDLTNKTFPEFKKEEK